MFLLVASYYKRVLPAGPPVFGMKKALPAGPPVFRMKKASKSCWWLAGWLAGWLAVHNYAAK
jgi:hypothetical protein